jgi:hypothetical protein
MIMPRHDLNLGARKAAAPDPADELQRKADRICTLIVTSDYPDVDIDIEIGRLREWCAEHLPERTELFEVVYANRFRRLREQFRA